MGKPFIYLLKWSYWRIYQKQYTHTTLVQTLNTAALQEAFDGWCIGGSWFQNNINHPGGFTLKLPQYVNKEWWIITKNLVDFIR